MESVNHIAETSNYSYGRVSSKLIKSTVTKLGIVALSRKFFNSFALAFNMALAFDNMPVG